MEYRAVVQSALDEIDRRITENIGARELALSANYSVYHFCRVFAELTGTPVSAYVTRRKLEHALCDLSRGGRIIDIAAEYGFETHAGFTKAFKRCFGCPPSLYRLHISAGPPERPILGSVKLKRGGNDMRVEIKQTEPFTIAGYSSRHFLPGVRGISSIPAYWDGIGLDYAAELETLHNTYARSGHCEIGVCFDVDEEREHFTYMIGVRVDEADADVTTRPGVCLLRIKGGLYAVFTTPPVGEAEYTKSIHDVWERALGQWLPDSRYVYDDGRDGFEYYDERDHDWSNDGLSSMDVYVPVRER